MRQTVRLSVKESAVPNTTSQADTAQLGARGTAQTTWTKTSTITAQPNTRAIGRATGVGLTRPRPCAAGPIDRRALFRVGYHPDGSREWTERFLSDSSAA